MAKNNKLNELNEGPENSLVGSFLADANPKDFCFKSCQFSAIHYMIKARRIALGYTQEEFCKKIKVNRSSYSRYESGERQIPNKIMDRILDALDIVVSLEAKDHEIFDEMEAEKDRD